MATRPRTDDLFYPPKKTSFFGLPRTEEKDIQRIDITNADGTGSDRFHIRLHDRQVSHGMTLVGPDDMMGLIGSNSLTKGGLEIIGLSDDAGATGLHLIGIVGSNLPTAAAIIHDVAKKNGTGTQALNPADTHSEWKNGGVVQMSLLASGLLTVAPKMRKGTYAAADTTPSVLGVGYLYIANAGAVTITQFDDGVEGQVIVLLFNDANTTVDRTNCVLDGGANFVSTQYDTLTLIKGPTYWHEMSRAANS